MKNIVVNFESKTIELTKNFSKRAGVVGSPEHHTLVEVKRAYPDYAIHVKNAPTHYTPSLYSKLTYADMETYIEYRFEGSQQKEKLDFLFQISETLGTSLAVDWFIKSVISPDDYENMFMVA